MSRRGRPAAIAKPPMPALAADDHADPERDGDEPEHDERQRAFAPRSAAGRRRRRARRRRCRPRPRAAGAPVCGMRSAIAVTRPSSGAAGRAGQEQRTMRSAPTKRTTRPWIMNVRFGRARAGRSPGRGSGSRSPLTSAPKRSAEKATPTAVFRPRSATAMPTNPTVETWMSLVESGTASRGCRCAREAGEGSGDRHREEVVPRDADAAVARRPPG